jgi:acyl carrier protein
MAAEPAHGEPGEQRLLAEVIAMLAQVTGESAQWLAQVGPASRLEGDLGLNSLDVVVLGDLLCAVHGERVDLPAYLAGLDIDEIIALTVEDVVGYVAAVGPAPRT